DGHGVAGPTVGNGQVVDLDVDTRVDPEHPADVAAADGELVRARAVESQVVADAELAAGQSDGPAQVGGDADHVGAGIGVGVEHRLPQRAGAAVGEVQDREGAG